MAKQKLVTLATCVGHTCAVSRDVKLNVALSKPIHSAKSVELCGFLTAKNSDDDSFVNKFHNTISESFNLKNISEKMATKIVKTYTLKLFHGHLTSLLAAPPKTQLANFAKYTYNVNKSSHQQHISRCRFSVDSILNGSAGRAETTSTTQGLSKLQAQELVLRLNGEERNILISALQEYQSKLVKDEYEGQLAASRWRSKYGRPSKLPRLGDVDPTGSYCPVPEDWLAKKWAESVPRPTTRNLVDIAIANSIPFIGFGFLDNFFMLLFGDYVDLYLGSYFCLTTMAAAAIGNTFSDVLGIGTAFYVERLANQIGFSPPKLSPIQMDMTCSRNSANFGRVMGVTIGCILGMLPLLFRKSKESEEKTKEKEK